LPQIKSKGAWIYEDIPEISDLAAELFLCASLERHQLVFGNLKIKKTTIQTDSSLPNQVNGRTPQHGLQLGGG